MNNKYIGLTIFFLLQAIGVTYSQKSNTQVFLNGTAKYFNNQVQIEDMSEMKDLILPNSKRIFTLDSLNHFSISFVLNKPGYFRIGRNILYISPGDSMTMFINRTWQDSSSFNGKGSSANEFLKSTPFPKAGSFLEAGDNVKSTIKQTVDEVLNIAERRKRTLEIISNISNEFKLLEQARINADIINSLKMIDAYFPYVNKINNDSIGNFRRDYSEIVEPYLKMYSNKVKLNPSYLQLVVYRQVIQTILSQVIGDVKNRNIINDWVKASNLVETFKEIKEKKSITSFEKEIEEIKTQKYKTSVIETFKKLMEFRNGDIAVDFIMTSSDNTPKHLSDFRGKFIYIDLWATWCGPCMDELPFLDSLKEKFRNNDHIVFISLSIDEDIPKWKNNLRQRNAFENQYIIDRANLNPYSIAEIPRVIIIDSEFRIESMNGEFPSSKNSISVLNKLLKY